MKGMADLIKKLCNKMATVNEFCYLENTLNSSGGYEVTVTARVRTG